MNPLSLLAKLVFFVAALWLAVNNLTPVSLRLTAQESVSLPLIVLLLLAVLVGAAATALALAPRLYRLRRQVQAQSAPVPAEDERPARGRSARPPAFGGERLVDAARNIGAVGELDPDTRIRK